MNKTLIEKILVSVIIFLFVFSSLIPIVMGNTVDDKVEDEYFDKIYFSNYDMYENIELENYREISKGELIEDSKSYDIPISKRLTPMLPLDGPMDSAWPMKCHDLHHTSQSPYSTAGSPDLEEKWRFRSDGWLEGSPIIGDDGTLYFGDSGWYLYAVHPNGSMKWSYHTGGMILSAPAIDEDGTVYVGSFDDFFYAINPDGSRKWKLHAIQSITSSPAIGEDGTIYFGTMMGGMNDGGEILAVNPNGTIKWRYQTGYHITSDPAIGDDGTIYIGSGDYYLYAMNPNGTLKWRFQTGDIIKSHASIAEDGIIYVGSFDGYTYAINPDGTEKWRFGDPGSGANSASIASDGTIIICGDDIYAVNPDGTSKWTFDIGEDNYIGHSSACISSDGTIYVGSTYDSTQGGEIIVVNLDGTLKWRKYIASNWMGSSPCIGEDGTVYIGSSSDTPGGYEYGYLHAFGLGEPNEPPTAPTIDGPTEVKWGEYHNYKFNSIDPEGGNIRYWIDWDDGLILEWEGPYTSGSEITIRNKWEIIDTYIIKARTEDDKGLYSDWSYLEVAVPVNQHPYSFPLLQRLFEQFPNAFPILRQLLELCNLSL